MPATFYASQVEINTAMNVPLDRRRQYMTVHFKLMLYVVLLNAALPADPNQRFTFYIHAEYGPTGMALFALAGIKPWAH